MTTTARRIGSEAMGIRARLVAGRARKGLDGARTQIFKPQITQISQNKGGGQGTLAIIPSIRLAGGHTLIATGYL